MTKTDSALVSQRVGAGESPIDENRVSITSEPRDEIK